MSDLKSKIEEAKNKTHMSLHQLSKAIGFNEHYLSAVVKRNRSESTQKKVIALLDDLIQKSQQELTHDFEGPKEAGTASVRNILHNKGTAAVIKASAEKNKKEIQRYTTGSAYIDFDGVRVNIDDYFLPKLNLKLTPLTSKLLQLMLVDATPLLNQAVTEIGLRLNLAEVASDLDRNIESKHAKYKFKKEFFNALEVLSRINLRVEEELNGKSINIGKARLLSSFMPSKTEKDTTEVILGLEFLKYLSNGYLKSFDMNILKIKARL